MIIIKHLISTILLFSVCVQISVAAGLATRLGELKIENVRYGQAFSMRESLNLPLRVTNRSATPVSLKMEIVINKPGDSDLLPGYEPLPDPSWIRLENEDFMRVEPNMDAETDIVIDIPKNDKYLGKQYQFYVWTRTVGGLTNVNLGVKSRFLITIISADNLAILEGRKEAPVIKSNLDFNFMPYESYMKQVATGTTYDVETAAGSAIKVINPNAEKMQFKVYPLTSKDAKVSLKSGYEDIPSADWITFKEMHVSVPPESIKRLKTFVKIPKNEEFKGKKYQAVLVLEGVGQNVNAKLYVRLFITTAE